MRSHTSNQKLIIIYIYTFDEHEHEARREEKEKEKHELFSDLRFFRSSSRLERTLVSSGGESNRL